LHRHRTSIKIIGEYPRAAHPCPHNHSYNGPFTVPSYGVRPGGCFLPTGAKGIPF
jgi:hypothetical protein